MRQIILMFLKGKHAIRCSNFVFLIPRQLSQGIGWFTSSANLSYRKHPWDTFNFTCMMPKALLIQIKLVAKLQKILKQFHWSLRPATLLLPPTFFFFSHVSLFVLIYFWSYQLTTPTASSAFKAILWDLIEKLQNLLFTFSIIK